MADNVIITCRRCNNQITHICSTTLQDAAVLLFKWRPMIGFPVAMKNRNPWIGHVKGSCDVDGPEIPFLSEVYQYALLGKEDGRTLLALVNNLLRAAGLDPSELEKAAGRELLAAKLARESAERRATRTRGRKELIPQIDVRLIINNMLHGGRTDKEIVAEVRKIGAEPPVTLRTLRAYRKLWTVAVAEAESIMNGPA